MADKSPFFWIILFALGVIAIAGAIGAIWYLETLNTGDTLQSAETSFSTLELQSISPGTHFVSDINIEIPVHQVPDKLMVYSKQQMSDEDIMRVASDLGISGEPVKSDSGWISIRDGSCIFTSQPGGRVISFINETHMPSYQLEFIESHLPSDDEARKIADAFLVLHNIQAEGRRFTGVNHGVGYYSTKDEKVKNDETLNVVYRHFIDGYEIFNDDLNVEVSFIGTVKMLFWKWTRYTPYKEYPVISPEEAVSSLQKTGIIVIGDFQNPERATVSNITIGYLGETRSKDIDYLIPIYKIEGVVYSNSSAAGFFQYVPASLSAAAEIA
jgi:hypothetical protein